MRRSQQELEGILDQYDLKHVKRGGLAMAAYKLSAKAGGKFLNAVDVVNKFFPDLPDEDRVALSDILNRDLGGDGRGWLRVLVTGGDIPLRLRLAKKSKWQMQGLKELKIEGAPALTIFELCDGFYWDGERATINGTTTPMPDGFYVCELEDDDFITKAPDGGDSAQGPYATVAEAERETRKAMADAEQIIRNLERAGLVRRKVGDDGMVRSQGVTLSPEEAERVWERLAMEYSEEELARLSQLGAEIGVSTAKNA
jgi:hypothetical protein